MKARVALILCGIALQGCIFSRNVRVRPSQGGGDYRLTFRNVRTGQAAVGYGYSIETAPVPFVPMLGTSFTGGPLDLHGATEWTFENDASTTWSVRLEPPVSRGKAQRGAPTSFDVNRVFREARQEWPQRFRVRDTSGKWEMLAERIGPARY